MFADFVVIGIDEKSKIEQGKLRPNNVQSDEVKQHVLDTSLVSICDTNGPHSNSVHSISFGELSPIPYDGSINYFVKISKVRKPSEIYSCVEMYV